MKKLSLSSLLHTGTSPDGVMHPARDWYLILLGTFILLIIVACWNLWVFSELASGKSLGAVAHTETQQQSVQVKDVQDIFKSRATERNHYENDYQFIDPSAPGS